MVRLKLLSGYKASLFGQWIQWLSSFDEVSSPAKVVFDRVDKMGDRSIGTTSPRNTDGISQPPKFAGEQLEIIDRNNFLNLSAI